LAFACKFHHFDVVEFLLCNGADVNTQNKVCNRLLIAIEHDYMCLLRLISTSVSMIIIGIHNTSAWRVEQKPQQGGADSARQYAGATWSRRVPEKSNGTTINLL
jgi:hypothetical protein